MDNAASSHDQAWQQALDNRLVRRLLRPLERPGMVRLRQAQAMLARHQGMAGGLPLAELLQRRARSAPDAPASAVPIVYAQPAAPVAPGALSPAGQVGTPAAMPIVPAAPAGDTARQSLPVSPSMAGSSAAPIVVQRKAVAGAPAFPSDAPGSGGSAIRPPRVASSPAPAAVQRRAAPSAAALPMPVVLPAQLPGRDAPATAAQAATVGPLPATAVNGQSAPRAAALALVYAHPAPAIEAHPEASLPPGSALPVVAVRRTEFAADAASSDATAPLVVREQAARAPAAGVTGASPRQPLPLAEPIGAARGRADRAGAGAEQPAAVRPATVAAPPNTVVAPPRPAPAQVDIDQIVDRVHRKFLRRLAIEGERRGGR